MEPASKNSKVLSSLLLVFYLIVLLSLIFSWRAISPISMGLLLIAGFIKTRVEQKRILNPHLKHPFFLFCCLFFLIQFISLAYTNDIDEGWRQVRQVSFLVVIQLALYYSQLSDRSAMRNLMKWYCLGLFIALVFVLTWAFKKYRIEHDANVFFYHELLLPLLQHAIQFSILVFIALVHLFESMRKNEILFHKLAHVLLIGFFIVFLFLLSSKLVIVFFIFYLIYFIFRSILYRTYGRRLTIAAITGLIIIAGFVFSTKNPVSKRFSEIIHSDLQFIRRDQFDPGDYFDGLQFRLLQWRFTTEILNENNAWLTGVTPGDAQALLDQKYISKKMYIGEPQRGDRGFLGYNTHSQILESLLQNGIPGLLVFLGICFSLIKMAWQRKDTQLSFTTILILAYSLTESVFETQYSLMIFCFFPLFFYLNSKKSMEP